MNDDERFVMLTRKEAAAFLRVKPQTLRRWACTGRYDLPFSTAGARSVYALADLKAFLEGRRRCFPAAAGEEGKL